MSYICYSVDSNYETNIMGKSISIIFLKQESTDSEGILYIRTIEGRVPKRKSLGIKIKETDFKKFFNKKTLRFKSDKRFARGEDINFFIRDKLKELSKNDNELSYLPDEKKSFIKYWEDYLESFVNHGTKIKHQVVLSKIKKYLEHKSKVELLFVEITPTMLRELKNYLSKVRDPKVLSNNSVNHYLKIFKSVLNRAYKDDYFVYTKNPFASFDFKRESIIKNVLTADELTSLLSTSIENIDISLARDMFMFQLFSNGMRVSDVLLLRWNCFDKERLNYRMFKTANYLSVPVNINIASILYNQLGVPNRYDDMLKVFEHTTTNENGKIKKVKLSEIEEQLSQIVILEKGMSDEQRAKFNHLIDTNDVGKYREFYYFKKNEISVMKLIQAREQLIKHVDDVYVRMMFSKIRTTMKNKTNNFVFPVLKNSEFKNIKENNDFSKLSLEQYKALKHATIIYNRRLKKVQEICNITTNMTTHLARHSFTNILLTMKDVNLYDISQSLGHANITITENYIRSGFNIEKVDYINKDLSQKYRIN